MRSDNYERFPCSPDQHDRPVSFTATPRPDRALDHGHDYVHNPAAKPTLTGEASPGGAADSLAACHEPRNPTTAHRHSEERWIEA